MKNSPLGSSSHFNRDHCAFWQFHRYNSRMLCAILGTFNIALSFTPACICLEIFFLNWPMFPKQILQELPMERLCRDVCEDIWDEYIHDLPLKLDCPNKIIPKTEWEDTKRLAAGTGSRACSISMQRFFLPVTVQSVPQPSTAAKFCSSHSSQSWRLYKLLLIIMYFSFYPQLLNLKRSLLTAICWEFCPLTENLLLIHQLSS